MPVTVIVLGSVSISSCFLSNVFVFRMIGELNRKRPDNDQVSYFSFTPSKTGMIFRTYRQMYPRGRFHI
jgi:hypothetical protein